MKTKPNLIAGRLRKAADLQNEFQPPPRFRTLFAAALVMAAFVLATHTATAALVSHWALNENTGITAADSGPAHNTGTLTNSGTGTIGWTTGIEGSAVALTGISSSFNNGGFVTMGNAASLDFESTNAFSISAWMKTPAGFGQDATIAGKMIQPFPIGKYLGYELHFRPDTGVLIWLVNTFNTGATDRAIQVSSSAVAVNDGNWHQVAFTYNGNGLAAGVTIYIDGYAYPNVVFADSLGTNTMLNNVSFNIGSRDDAADHNFTGSIDDVQVYNSVLTPAQMLSLYQHPGTSINASVIDWVSWTNAVAGVPGTAKGTISATGVGVTYAGEIRSYVAGLPSWGPATTFSGGAISNPPPSNSGIIQIIGGNTGVNTITFSQPVVDPVMAIWSLGNRVNPATFAFPTNEPVTIESGGPSSEFGASLGGSTITLTNNIIYGTEGNGTIQIHGTFTQISWTNPIAENWFGYTVGVPETLPLINPPAFLTQPQSLSVNAGQNASFTVTATGTAPLTYQWYYNTNTALAIGTNTTLTLANVQTNQAGNYTVVLTDGNGRSVTSSVAVLMVVPPPKPPGIVLIAGGDDFSLYGNSAGNLWAMGDNYAGQLGDGTDNNIITVPELIVAGAGIALAAGNNHSLIIKTGGSLWTAGDNTDGQLGDGTYNPTNYPELIVSNNVTAVAAGFFHSLFTKSDGSLWAMGDNSFGQLGDGTDTLTNQPEQIVSGGVTAISAGYRHSLFLKSDGSLWGIGGNNYGQLGDGTGNNATVPEQLLASNVTAIAAGGLHSLFIKSDGSLWAMGDNEDGELGDDTSNYETNQPEMIVPSGVTAIAAGFYHSLFLKNDGSLWAMGLNNYGQLGDGTFNSTNQPEMIVPSGVTAIAAGFYHSLYIKSDGSLWAMGFNEYGELGDGQLNNTNSPEQLVAGVTTNSALPFFTAPLFTNGSFQATLNGLALSNYVIYVSSNLINWTTLKTVSTTAGGSTNVTDTSGSQKLRFYRAKLGP
jgi:alpha-tubulin suppressor-like RCC1 family protein